VTLLLQLFRRLNDATTNTATVLYNLDTKSQCGYEQAAESMEPLEQLRKLFLKIEADANCGGDKGCMKNQARRITAVTKT